MIDPYEGKLIWIHPMGATLFVTGFFGDNFTTSMYSTNALPDTEDNRKEVARIIAKFFGLKPEVKLDFSTVGSMDEIAKMVAEALQ